MRKIYNTVAFFVLLLVIIYCVWLYMVGGSFLYGLMDVGYFAFDLLMAIMSNVSSLFYLLFIVITFGVVIFIFFMGITNYRSVLRIAGICTNRVTGIAARFFSEITEEDNENGEKESLVGEIMDVAPISMLIVSICLSIVLACTTYITYFTPAGIRTAEQVDPTSMPVVSPLTSEEPFTVRKDKDYTIIPISKYKISGIVVAKNTFLLDGTRKIGPIDIGLIYGKLAEPEYRKYVLFFTSFARRLHPHFKPGMPLDDVCNYHSHNHIIPADDNIFKAVNSLRNGEAVTFKGYLANVQAGPITWGTPDMVPGACDASLMGGCEIVYVSEVVTDNKVYR